MVGFPKSTVSSVLTFFFFVLLSALSNTCRPVSIELSTTLETEFIPAAYCSVVATQADKLKSERIIYHRTWLD